ncbi:MAG: nicotinate (nicotinamide) nucleotide adenylyltransferase [Firmicutes bacterium]|nr:nicotinate (nicotinamide) nucleotide adenylyltransferase [Bacillota bacterium]
MAKECAVCGKTISLLEKSVKLKYAGAHLCTACGHEAEQLLYGARNLNNVDDEEKLNDVIGDIKENFYAELKKSHYSPYIKSILKDELLYNIGANAFRKVIIRKYFRAGFDEADNAVYEAGKSASETVLKTDLVKTDAFSQRTYIFEKMFLRTESYTSLHVDIINSGGITIITTIGAGGGDGYSNNDWGTEKAFVSDFWRAMRAKKRMFMEKETEIDNPARIEITKDGFGVTNRIGIFGGTFDPIHLGHKALGEAALREGSIDKLIVMPAKVQPFKQGKRVTEPEHRFAMAKLTFEGNEKVEVSDYELNNTTISYTYDTMKYLQGIYPDKKLCFILGTDSFLMLEDWYKGIELLENFSFIVGDRPGYREAELDEAMLKYKSKYGTETIKITADMPDISATEIREALKADKSIDDLVTDAVERYIKENGLYN